MNYESGIPIIILHGWGLRGSAYDKLASLLKEKGYRIFSPDLPGFGREPLAKEAMTLEDYATFVKDFIQKKHLRKVIFIGHSFGGRVAIKFSVKFPNFVHALVLTGAPGIKHRLSFVRRVVMCVSVVFGEVFRSRLLLPLKETARKGLYFLIGEWDYYKAGDLQETFKRIVSEALQDCLPQIKAPTLLLWGEKDRIIPVSDARRMRSLIPKCQLVVVENAGHKLPYEKPEAFVSAIQNFLR